MDTGKLGYTVAKSLSERKYDNLYKTKRNATKQFELFQKVFIGNRVTDKCIDIIHTYNYDAHVRKTRLCFTAVPTRLLSVP